MRRIVSRLHQARRHEDVIALIETILIEGEAQPWMYEVLALSMEIAGRPRAEVQRVLFSAVDFTGGDPQTVLLSAAYLARFGRDAPALHLYRQAARLAPYRPEPYIQGLRLARKLKDHDAVGWAAAGVLTTAWQADHQRLHRDAEAAAQESEDQLRREGRANEADRLANLVREARQRDLVIRLDWSGDGDLDLAVEEPPGTICSATNRQSRGGGVHVRDGFGPDQKNCWEEYVCVYGMPGNYRVIIRHVWGNIVGKRARLTVVRNQGSPSESTRTFTVPLDGDETAVRIVLEEGRRTELAPPLPRDDGGTDAAASPRMRPRVRLPQDAEARRLAREFAESRRRAGSAEPGFSPVIATISEGVSLGAMAVVSGDRRYVRIGVSPTFSTLTDVFTFSFFGTGPAQPGGAGAGQAAGNP